MAAPTSLPLPNYMTGKQASSFIVNGAKLNSSNNLVYTANQDWLSLGIFRSWSYQGRVQMADIKPSNFYMENNVEMGAGFEVSLSDLRTDNGYDNLTDIFAAGNNILRVFLQNTGIVAAGYVFCVIGKIQTNGINQGEGEHNGSVTLVPCGIPAYYGPSGSNPI